MQMICQMFSMIIKHASHILRSNGGGRDTHIGHYLSFTGVRRKNDLLDLGDLALPLLFKASEKLLELPHLLDLPTLFGGLSVHLKRLALLLWDLLQSHHDDILQINLGRHV
jgi:hypothetical protein